MNLECVIHRSKSVQGRWYLVADDLTLLIDLPGRAADCAVAVLANGAGDDLGDAVDLSAEIGAVASGAALLLARATH